jgi:hypothetical protein
MAKTGGRCDAGLTLLVVVHKRRLRRRHLSAEMRKFVQHFEFCQSRSEWIRVTRSREFFSMRCQQTRVWSSVRDGRADAIARIRIEDMIYFQGREGRAGDT